MERDGVVLPQVLAEQPRLPVGLLMYLDAFYELDTERNYITGMHGATAARIPWSKIVQYGLHYGYDVEELLFFIRKMDDAYLERVATQGDGGGGGSSSPREMVHRPPRPD